MPCYVVSICKVESRFSRLFFNYLVTMMANYKTQTLADYGSVTLHTDAGLTFGTGFGEGVMPSDITDSFVPDSIFQDRDPARLVFQFTEPSCVALRQRKWA